MKKHYKYQVDTTHQYKTNVNNQSNRLSSNTNTSKHKQPKEREDTTKIYGFKNINAISIRNSNQLKKSIEVKEPTLFNPIPLNKSISAWQIIMLFILIVLVAISKAFNQSRVKQLLKSILNYSVAQEVIREEKVFFHRANLWLTLVYIFTISLLLYQFKYLTDTNLGEVELTKFYTIVGFIVIMYFIKYLSTKVLFLTFNYSELSTEYIFNISVYNILLGVILIPILMIIYFTSINLLSVLKYFIAPIVIIIYLLRLIRIFVAGNNYRFSYFYIFLYICTLEILPLVVLYKVFIHR